MEKALLAGPMIGEFGWSVLRFAPYILGRYQNKYNSKVKLIVYTRPDRFDLYGQHADILVPLRIDGDGTKYKCDCFRLMNYPISEYDSLTNQFNKHFSNRFQIVEHIFPNIKGKIFARKDQFNHNEMLYNFKPREENKEALDKYIPKDKPLVVIAPRFRSGMRRNWPHWSKLYDLIFDNKELIDNFYFVVCGKNGHYIPDSKYRVYDLDNIEQNNKISLVGLTIESIKRSILTVGSQSGIPNLSLLLGTEVLEWGHQRHFHTVTYNVKKTKITFLDDPEYSLSEKRIVEEMLKILRRKKK